MPLLEGNIALVLGVANKFSIAWSIAQALHREGAQLILTYQGERLERSVRAFGDSLPGTLVYPCDLSDETQIDTLFATIEREKGGLDTLVHAVAYAPTDALEGRYLDTSRDAFQKTLEISAYTLTAVMQRAEPLMKARGGGSAITLSYLGGERVVPHYNVMGVAKAALDMSVRYLAYDLGPSKIRINGISAGPINTASARAISGFHQMMRHVTGASPFGRPTELDEVAETAVYLASRMSTGMTGEVLHIDCGFHVMGIVAPDHER